MGWSTREVAELAGTTLRTVRHYHDVGLLPEPERLPNGYKAYRAEHLVRLLEIRRLTRLGFSLPMIAAMDEQPGDLDDTLDAVDADLVATIARLGQAREEIARLRRHRVPTDLPVDIAVAAADARLSPADRSLLAVLTQVAGEQTAEHWQGILRDYEPDAAVAEFDELPADSDEATRQRLADRMAGPMAALLARHPAPPDLAPQGAAQPAVARTVIDAMLDLYNPAQLDVLARAWRAAGLI